MLAVCGCLAIAPGCGPDDDGSAGDGSAGSGSGGADATAGDDLPGGTVAPGDDTAADETAGPADDTAGDDDPPGTGEPVPPPPATGIEITEVTFDQGIRIPIARNGELVGPTERNASILQGRPAVIRAFYDTDPGYATRSIYAVLTVHLPGGGTSTYESFITTSEPDCAGETWLYDCRYGSPTGSFVFRLDPEDVVPGIEYSMELFETAPGHEDDVSDKVPRFPTAGGSMVVGVEDTYMKMRVVIVPFDHNVGAECPDPPDLNEEFGADFYGNPRTIADFFGERLYAQNPIDEVEMIVHDVVNYTGSATSGGGLLGLLQQLRNAEGAPPGHYYYGVIRPCNGGPDFSGIAQLGGPSPGQANQRVGWGVYHQNVGTTAETFVHEIGHEQGRSHIRCSGDEAGVNTSYPDHPEGDTEGWGVDVMSNPINILPPSSHDYMTYCGSTWVSEWGWHRVSPWIEEISSWELSNALPETRDVLVGTVYADGRSEFYVTNTWFDPEQAKEGHTVRFTDRDGRVIAEPAAQWVHWEKTEDYNVIVPLPADLDDLGDLSWHMPGRSGAIDRESLVVVGSLATP